VFMRVMQSHNLESSSRKKGSENLLLVADCPAVLDTRQPAFQVPRLGCVRGKTRTIEMPAALIRVLPCGVLRRRGLGVPRVRSPPGARRPLAGGDRRFAKLAPSRTGGGDDDWRKIRFSRARRADAGIRESGLSEQSNEPLLFLQTRVVHRTRAAGQVGRFF